MCAALLPLNRFVYARVKPGGGANNSIVQIMSRFAGADLNYNAGANTSARVTNTFNNTAMTSPVDFAGGADGPFAYLNAPIASFGKNLSLWGMWTSNKAGTPTDPGAATDIIHVRTKRTSNLTVSFTVSSGGFAITTPASTHRNFLFDDGTIWSGEDGQLQFNPTSNGVFSSMNAATANFTLRVAARKKYGLKITYTANSTTYHLMLGNGALLFTALENVQFAEGSSTTRIFVYTGGSSTNISFKGCKFDYAVSHTMLSNSGITSADYASFYRWDDCEFTWTGVGTNVTGLFAVSNPASVGTVSLMWSKCRFIVDSGNYKVTAPVTNGSLWGYGAQLQVTFEQCSGMSDCSVGVAAAVYPPAGFFLWESPDSDRQFRYECSNYIIDWLGSSVHPYYNATLPSGNAACHRIAWETARMPSLRPVKVGKYAAFHRSATAARTITLEVLAPTAEIPSTSQCFMVVKYISGGAVVVESTAKPYALEAAGLATDMVAGVGTGSWTLNGLTGASSVKLTLTTASSVDINTMITADLYLQGPPASNRSIYVNPDLQVT